MMSAAERAERDRMYNRPLNVRDALSYLDQVKVKFASQPEVYNKFLDVMKEFKGQVIDTPGVIDRVSTLFRGHPSLIQGFNTFLPPGYRIDCVTSGEGNQGMITVTTPTGTVSEVAGKFAATMRAGELEAMRREQANANRRSPPRSNPVTSSSSAGLAAGPPPLAGSRTSPAAQPAPAKPPTASLSMPPAATPAAPSGPSTPSAAQLLASGMTTPAPGLQPAPSLVPGGASRAPILEFNHAISFVNRIKTRFGNDPETYKQFLEILQTYQRDTKDIAEVYEQVSKLFQGAPDLIDEFKQFMPENDPSGFGGGMGVGGVLQAANQPSMVPDARAGTGKRGSKDMAAAQPPKKRRGNAQADARKKKAAKADSPSGEEGESSILPSKYNTLASADEVAFFDKVKKFIDDKYTYHEFLKLINLFTQDLLDTTGLIDRAELFIGQSGEVWQTFKKMVLAEDAGTVPADPNGARAGYGMGGMIQMDHRVFENTPMLDRVKPDLSSSKVKSYGPSYRKLPSSEIALQCSGRDAMCWEVLNDEWVSHPTWAAEDAAPFMTHKKNAYEEALHKSEEERHEYDYHIEANLRTIALFEPLNNKIQTMDPEERSHYNLRAGLGGQSKSIYQRIIKKVYGKELGPDIIRAIHENPVVALPIVLERLKAKDDEWKKAQRDWNRVWREQDAKNFYKALDHQGVQFKQNDKKTLAAKSLIGEAEARRREHTNARAAILHSSSWRSRPQFEFEFKDIAVVKDVVKLSISYLDRVTNALTPADKERIERHLRDFIPYLFLLDKEAFDAEFGEVDREDEESEESDGDVSMADEDETSSNIAKRKKAPAAADLRKKLLKQVGENNRGATATPGPDDESVEGTPATDLGERGETPVPVPDDPEAVAEAVEKDRVDAEASEQTWVNVDIPEPPKSASEATEEEAAWKPPRKANFFANNQYYVLLRLIQLLYARLLTCKQAAQEMAREKKRPINPIAIKLGLAEPDTQFFGIESGDNPAEHYYDHLLGMAERLFENEVDSATYEETLRLMFGTKAFTLFTLDRVVAAIVKQTQTVLGDMKSQELFALLQRDRAAEEHTARSQIAYRNQAETLLGPEENLYKIVFHSSRELISVQLMGKEDVTVDEAETAEAKWRNYVDSYVLTCPTEGLPHRIDPPFLKRSLAKHADEEDGGFQVSSGLGLKFALKSFKMFSIPDGEDFFYRRRKTTDVEQADKREEAEHEAANKRLLEWLDPPAPAEGQEPAAPAPAPAAEPEATTAA